MSTFGTVIVTREMPYTDWLRVSFLSPMAMCVWSEYLNRIRGLLAKKQGGMMLSRRPMVSTIFAFLILLLAILLLFLFCAFFFPGLPLKCCLSFKIILLSVLFYSDYTFSVGYQCLTFDYYLELKRYLCYVLSR